MELINIENLITLDDANIVKNIKFARNLVKKYNSEYIIFLPHEIVNIINSRTIKILSHLSNIKNFLSDNFFNWSFKSTFSVLPILHDSFMFETVVL